MEISKNANYFSIKFNEEELKELTNEKDKVNVESHYAGKANSIVITRTLYEFIEAAILASYSISRKNIIEFDNLKVAKYFNPFL